MSLSYENLIPICCVAVLFAMRWKQNIKSEAIFMGVSIKTLYMIFGLLLAASTLLVIFKVL